MMGMAKKWDFPKNRHGTVNGLGDPGDQLFNGDPLENLAREMVQNSNDARLSQDCCVTVEFKTFDINRDEIPNIDGITRQIDAGIETYMGANDHYVKTLTNMKRNIQNKKIHCCRISDFNTTGATDIYCDTVKEQMQSKWQALTIGSGISSKLENSGGSKGVGKFSIFTNSSFGTAFFSTNTVKNEKGWMGVSKICSVSIDGSREMTQGTGYYSENTDHDAIQGQFSLDPNFKRANNETGTDIYIAGFIQYDDDNKWAFKVIASILNSFMVAIMKGLLVIKVNDYEVNKENISRYIYDKNVVATKNALGRSITAQYLLLTQSGEPYEILVGNGYPAENKAKLYVLDCSNEYRDELKPNDKCIMIRYPYMRIQEEAIGTDKLYIAMCILEGKELIEDLRDVENALHTKWNFQRLDSEPGRRDKVKNAHNYIIEQIYSYINQLYELQIAESTPFEGTEEFLSKEDASSNKKDNKPSDSLKDEENNFHLNVTLSKQRKKSRVLNPKGRINDDNGNGVVLDISDGSEGDEEIVTPEGHNKGDNGEMRPGENLSSGSEADDGDIIFKLAPLRTTKFHFACIDKNKGKFAILFVSDDTVDDAVFEVSAVDDNGNKEKVAIFSYSVGGETMKPDAYEMIHLPLKTGEKVLIEIETDRSELFSAEVIGHARG